jgi:EXS family
VINTLLRFCWTLSFIPLRYLSAAGVLKENFSGDAWTSILAPTIASAEIVRRTLWGFLRVEWEAIKVQNEVANEKEYEDDGLEMTPMKMQGMSIGGSSLRPLSFTSDISSMTNIQILAELAMYTTIFSVLALIIAAHRETL